MSPSDWDFVDWNAPQPAAQRLSSTEDWTPPEFDDSNVSSGPIQWTNSGGVDGDPATMFTAEMLKEKLDIEATPIAVPSPRLQVKNLTPLSAKSAEPLMFHLNRQMYMDFVEPGWLEPLDPFHNDAEGIDDYYPGPYKSGSGSLWTDVDSTMDGEHIYGALWTAGGHFMHYRPDFLEELGFQRDLFDGVNTDYDWSDCLEVWRAAREQKDIYGFTWHGKTPRFAVRWWMADVLAQGGQIVSDDGQVQVDTPEAREAVEWEKQLMEENLVPNVLEMTQGTAIEQFLNGDTLSITHGGKVYNSALDRIGKEGEKVGMGIPPKADRGPDPWHATLTVYATLVMNRFAPTENKRAGLLFMDAQRAAVSEVQEFLMEGNMPQVTPAFEQMQEETQYAHVMKAWAENSVDPMWPRQLQSQNIIGEELQQAWGGQKETDVALKDAQAAVDDILYQG
jgi:ABC-type glycerol-3-phosphate transport system substrate-binding protein